MLSTGPVARCSWGCLHTHHQRTFLIVGVVSLPNYCRCPRSALPARCRKPRAPPWLPRTAAMAPFRLPTPTLIPSSLNQQETAGLARFSPAHLSFLDSCPHCDASGSRRPSCLEPNQGPGPSTSHGPAWSSNCLPCQSTVPPSTRQFQGSGLPPALGGPTSKVDLYLQAKLALRYEELKAERILAAAKNRLCISSSDQQMTS